MMDNDVVDALSRIEMNVFPSHINLVAMAKAQHTDPEVSKFILPTLTLSNISADGTIICDTPIGVQTFCVSNPSPCV